MAQITGQKRRSMDDNKTPSIGTDYATLKSLVSAFSSKSVDKRKSLVETKTNESLQSFTNTVSEKIQQFGAESETCSREHLETLAKYKTSIERLQEIMKDSRIRVLHKLATDLKALERLYHELQETVKESDEIYSLLETSISSSNTMMDDQGVRTLIHASIAKVQEDMEQRMEKYKQEMRNLVQLLNDIAV